MDVRRWESLASTVQRLCRALTEFGVRPPAGWNIRSTWGRQTPKGVKNGNSPFIEQRLSSELE